MSNSRNQVYLTFTAISGGSNFNLADYVDNWVSMTLSNVNIVCDSTLGTIAIALPRIQDMPGLTNLNITIADIAGSAAANNITITCGGSDKYQGNNTVFVLDSNNGSIFLRQTRNNSSSTTGGWLLMQPEMPFSPLFTNNATAGTLRYSLSAISQAAQTVFAGPVTGPDAAPSFKTLASLGVIVATPAAATLNFDATAAQRSQDLTVSVANVDATMLVLMNPPSGSIPADCCFTAWISATNQLTVRFSNYSAAPIDPPAMDFRFLIFKP